MKFSSKLAVAAVAGALLAGTASRIVRHAPCSALVVRQSG
jgi:nucleotide-binding universal stress UspA family protein